MLIRFAAGMLLALAISSVLTQVFTRLDLRERWMTVREGFSPRFAKYGASMRFDAVLRDAEREARAAARGLWAPEARSYPDYAERTAWWERPSSCRAASS